MNKYYEKKFEFDILNGMKIIYCGKREHSINHSFAPHTRSTFIISLITEGDASLHFGENSVTLHKNYLYVIFPLSNAYYTCVKDTPWSIKWVVIEGDEVEKYLSLLGLTPNNPYVEMHSPAETELILNRLFDNFDSVVLHNKMRCIADIHLLFASIAAGSRSHEISSPCIRKTVAYIEQNFHKPITVEELSKLAGVSYNYFSTLFKSQTSMTPHEMIHKHKLDKARKLLLYTDKTVKEIAVDVGYMDVLYFSRLFKKYNGVSPMKFRLSNMRNDG